MAQNRDVALFKFYRYSGSPGKPSCSTSGGQAERSRISRVLPCTVSQLRSALEQKETFFIDGMEINQVALVGVVRRTKPALEYVVYSLDDMTGPFLDVKQWMDLEDADTGSCVISPSSYIKVVGSLRSFQNHRTMVAFSVRRVKDLNEITSHMLEVVQAHLLSDRSPCTVEKNKAVTSTIINVPRASQSTSYGFTANQSRVYNLIKNCPLPEGLSVRSLRAALGSLSLYDIGTCLKFLVNEGHIFSTIDDDHFKSTYF